MMAMAFGGESQNWNHHKELFVRGTLTDSKGVTWDILFMPGSRPITDSAKENWEDSAEPLKNLVDKSFYRSYVVGPFEDGVEFAFNDAWKENWYDGISSDFSRALKDKPSFGGFFGKAVGWGWFVMKGVGRTIGAPLMTAGGLTYAVGVPVLSVAVQPVATVWLAGVAGTVVPSALYVWNGAAWVATYFSDLPESESWLVEIVNDGDGGGNSAPQTYVIDKIGLVALMKGSVRQAISTMETAPLLAERMMLEEKIERNSAETSKVENRLYTDPDYTEMKEIFRAAWNRHVEIDEEIRTIYMDRAALKAIVQEYLSEIGAESSDELVEEAVVQILENVKMIQR